MSALLEIKDLWGGYKEGVDILRGISMEVQKGEAIGIIGLNGSGKSTLGKAIMNMIPIRSGTIFFDGEDITSLKTFELAKRGITIMQQGGKVFPNLSVWDNLQLATLSNKSERRISNSQLRDFLPLLQHSKNELQHHMADNLSGGQKHQLSLAMTLVTNPRLVIFDEPSAGLSPKSVDEMYRRISSISEQLGISIILIEQNIAKAVTFCNYLMMLKYGNVFLSHSGDFTELEKVMFNN